MRWKASWWLDLAASCVIFVASFFGTALSSAQAPLVTESQFLTPTPALVASDFFGKAVSVWEDVAVVTAPGRNIGPLWGSAFVFRRTTRGQWQQEQEVLGSTTAEGFGRAASVDGNLLAVGSPNYSTPGCFGCREGAARVYRRVNGTWSQEAFLAPVPVSTNFAFFGESVALSGDVLAVAAPGFPAPGGVPGTYGRVYVYRDAGMQWVEEAILEPSPPFVPIEFGEAIAADGDRVVVGDYRSSTGSVNMGAVYVYRFLGGAWVEEARLLPSDGVGDEFFGTSVVIHGDLIAVAAPLVDAVYLFRYDGTQWIEEQKLEGPGMGGPSARFGTGVAAEEDVVLVGSIAYDFGAGIQGAVFVYRYQSGVWSEAGTLVAGDPGVSYPGFGISIALSNAQAFVGSPDYSPSLALDRIGAAYVYDLSTPDFVRGDTNGDGNVNLQDPIASLLALFVPGTPPLGCPDAADVNDDESHNLSDVVQLLATLFIPGSAPPMAPYPLCGPDPTVLGLACASPAGCP